VHDDVVGAGGRGSLCEAGILGAAYVIDDTRAGGQRGHSHLRLDRIDGNPRPELARQHLDDRHHPRDFFAGRHGFKAVAVGVACWSRRFAPNVEYIGTLPEQRPTVIDRRAGIEVPTTVAE